MDAFRPFTVMGYLLIILGLIFVALPMIVRVFPSIDKIPWIILWVYRRDGLYFATSPILIILSILSIIYSYLNRLNP